MIASGAVSVRLLDILTGLSLRHTPNITTLPGPWVQTEEQLSGGRNKIR